MDAYRIALSLPRTFAPAFGSVVIFVGIALAAFDARGAGGRGRVARQVMGHAALGSEFCIAATILNLILNPAWTTVAAIAVTIMVRKLMSTSLGLDFGERALGGPESRMRTRAKKIAVP